MHAQYEGPCWVREKGITIGGLHPGGRGESLKVKRGKAKNLSDFLPSVFPIGHISPSYVLSKSKMEGRFFSSKESQKAIEHFFQDWNFCQTFWGGSPFCLSDAS